MVVMTKVGRPAKLRGVLANRLACTSLVEHLQNAQVVGLSESIEDAERKTAHPGSTDALEPLHRDSRSQKRRRSFSDLLEGEQESFRKASLQVGVSVVRFVQVCHGSWRQD